MKTIYKLRWSFVLLLVAITACNSDERESLKLDKDVFIKNFTINGVDGVIDNREMTVKVMMPPRTDMTALSPVVVVDGEATVTPRSGEKHDFTHAVTYKVLNGNVYNNYTVSVDVIKAKITKFVLDGKFPGVIDQVNNRILVVVPTSQDVTTMQPAIEYTDGAIISPDAGAKKDFTRPVTYTLNYLNENFAYEVTVEKRDESFAFIGVAESADDQINLDERTAAMWMKNNIPGSQYVSFENIKSGAIDLSQFDALWIHYDAQQSLPSVAVDRKVVAALKTYYENGGNLFLSGFACLYVADLGITTFLPNNTFGSTGTDNPLYNLHELWGIAITGCDNHPIYKDLIVDRTGGWPIVYLLGYDISRRNNGSIWNLEASPFEVGWSKFTQKTGGVPLASFNWDDDCDQRVNIVEFLGSTSGKGNAICVGAPSYDWFYEGNSVEENTYFFNIEKLTKNILEYIIKK